MSGDLDRRARAAGIEPGFYDLEGSWHVTSPATKAALLEAMGPPDDTEELPQGPFTPAVTPAERGFGRLWGVACQTYGLRSPRNAGIGDFADLERLGTGLATRGADLLGLSPLHARFRDQPERACPYAPSSRLWLDPFAIALDAAAAELGLELPALPALPRGEFVDYPAMAAIKEQAFASLHERFAGGHPANADFHEWRADKGTALERFARFEAIGLTLRARTGRPVAWPDWPVELRRVDAPGVAAFAAEHAAAVERSAFLQWLAERQLTRTQQALMDAGMRIGLYADIAVGVVPDGADVWADPEAVVAGATIGAPPDAFSPLGQNWNVAPLSPMALRRRDMGPLRAMLQAAMQHAGAVRIDHAMGLMRLFWIPAGGTPADGAYVRYPLQHMLATVAEVSRANDCIVIGEDLGTVAPGFREAMQGAGLLSYKVVWFERWESGLFHASGRYPEAALATVSTHDLATVRGYLCGRDIDWREKAGQLDAATAAAARAERSLDCRKLRDALRFEGLLDVGVPADDEPEAIALALHRFLARTPSAIAMAQLEDLDGAIEQPNLPATIDEHPNWRQRTIHDIAGLLGSGPAQRLIQALAEERPRG